MEKEHLDWLLSSQSISKPVYKSLLILAERIGIDCIEGSCGKHKSFTPFYIKLSSGKFLCQAKQIHELAASLT